MPKEKTAIQASEKSTLSQNKPARKERAVWSPLSELRLLRAVCKYNPYAAKHGKALKTWELVALESLEVFGGVTGESCRAKTAKLVAAFELHQAEHKTDTGVSYNEEAKIDDMVEDQRLFLDILQMIEDVESNKTAREEEDEAQKNELRDSAMQRLKDKRKAKNAGLSLSSDQGSTSSRAKGSGTRRTKEEELMNLQIHQTDRMNDLLEKSYDVELKNYTLRQETLKLDKDNTAARLLEAQNNSKLMDILQQTLSKQ
jgi:hypothetical protein